MSVEGGQLQFVKTQDIEDKSSSPVSQAAYYISVHDLEDITLSTGLKECQCTEENGDHRSII